MLLQKLKEHKESKALKDWNRGNERLGNMLERLKKHNNNLYNKMVQNPSDPQAYKTTKIVYLHWKE